MEFAAGDTVQLKSGGPFMTVEQVGEHWPIKGPAVWCVWFEKVGSKQVVSRDTFPSAALDKAERSGITSVPAIRV
ncbi:MAG: YodC family protein [Proteobacteria bacterium]|nr:YodC family protein [Pseudomonadota bacterium]